MTTIFPVNIVYTYGCIKMYVQY